MCTFAVRVTPSRFVCRFAVTCMYCVLVLIPSSCCPSGALQDIHLYHPAALSRPDTYCFCNTTRCNPPNWHFFFLSAINYPWLTLWGFLSWSITPALNASSRSNHSLINTPFQRLIVAHWPVITDLISIWISIICDGGRINRLIALKARRGSTRREEHLNIPDSRADHWVLVLFLASRLRFCLLAWRPKTAQGGNLRWHFFKEN